MEISTLERHATIMGCKEVKFALVSSAEELHHNALITVPQKPLNNSIKTTVAAAKLFEHLK